MNCPSLWERPVFPHLQLQALTHIRFQINAGGGSGETGISNLLRNAVLLVLEEDGWGGVSSEPGTFSMWASPATWAIGSEKN